MRDEKGMRRKERGEERGREEGRKEKVAILQPEQEGRVDAIWNLYMAKNSNAHHYCIP